MSPWSCDSGVGDSPGMDEALCAIPGGTKWMDANVVWYETQRNSFQYWARCVVSHCPGPQFCYRRSDLSVSPLKLTSPRQSHPHLSFLLPSCTFLALHFCFCWCSRAVHLYFFAYPQSCDLGEPELSSSFLESSTHLPSQVEVLSETCLGLFFCVFPLMNALLCLLFFVCFARL